MASLRLHNTGMNFRTGMGILIQDVIVMTRSISSRWVSAVVTLLLLWYTLITLLQVFTILPAGWAEERGRTKPLEIEPTSPRASLKWIWAFVCCYCSGWNYVIFTLQHMNSRQLTTRSGTLTETPCSPSLLQWLTHSDHKTATLSSLLENLFHDFCFYKKMFLIHLQVY